MRRLIASATAFLMVTTLGLAATTAPAQAGDADDSGKLTAAIYNVTPYTMRLWGYDSQYGWKTTPTTAPAGGGALYSMNGSPILGGGICFGSWKNSYNGWMTWEVDAIGGPKEYVTIAIYGDRTHSTAVGCAGFVPPNDTYPSLTAYTTTSAPVAPWTPQNGAAGIAPGPLVPDSQLTNTYNTPYLFDQTIGIAGDWTADASTPLGRGLDDLLNSICGQEPDNCDFTQTGDLVWGSGAPVSTDQDINCDAPGTPASNYTSVGYEATREATLSVGGGVTASTEANLFGVIGSKISVSVEAEHEWKEIESIDREAKAFIPPQNSAVIWVAPNIGTVRGTMRLKTGTSTFTLLNFRQVRSGVTKDDQTPAYNAITEVRPATPTELHKFCRTPRPTAAERALGSVSARTGAALVPGRGVGRITLGAARDAARLGAPLMKAPRANRNPRANDCLLLDPRCALVAGRGTWVYADAAVVFGGDRRVSALIYSGRARTAAGIGIGSRIASVRRAYPAITCLGSPGAVNCSLHGGGASSPVTTTFHLERKKGRAVVEKVMIYRADTTRRGWGA